MAVDRLVEEIRKLSPQERAELVRKLGWRVPANADDQPTRAAAFQRIGFGMWAGRKEPRIGTVGARAERKGMEAWR